MPRGCQGARCETEFTLYARELTGNPILARFLGTEISITPRFTIAINDIDQAANGEANYQFLPDRISLTLPFTDFLASFEGRYAGVQYDGEVHLNPIAGHSETEFVKVDPNQPDFFPATQYLRLFFQFRLTLPGLFAKRELVIFNKEPMRFVSAIPLTGFPPIDDPEYVWQGPVEMYDTANPNGNPIGRFGKGKIMPIADVAYDVSGRLLSSSPPEFVSELSVTRTNGHEPIATAILVRPYPGCELAGAQNLRAQVGDTAVTFEVRIRQANPNVPVGYFARIASNDADHLGFGRADVTLAGADLTRSFLGTRGRPQMVQSGGRLVLAPNSVPQLAAMTDTPTRHIWITPHGLKLEGPADSPNCTLPVVDRTKEMWFTHFAVVRGQYLGPFVHMVRVQP
jgi:hypothetical protein